LFPGTSIKELAWLLSSGWMGNLEIRRHSLTKKDSGRGRGSHLSQEGVALARQLGSERGPFDAVFTSQIPRTMETALAMGYAVNDCLEVLGHLPAEYYEQVGRHDTRMWQTLAELGELARKDGPARRLALAVQEAWQMIARGLPDRATALVVSHGNLIELGLVAVLANEGLPEERPFAHLEGVRLAWEGTRFGDPTFLRMKRG
jgi:broad specificity phosphatase PhoE